MFFVVVLCVCRLTDLQEQLTLLNQQLHQLQEYQQYANTAEEVQYSTIYVCTYRHTYINMYIIICIMLICVCTYTYDTYVFTYVHTVQICMYMLTVYGSTYIHRYVGPYTVYVMCIHSTLNNDCII